MMLLKDYLPNLNKKFKNLSFSGLAFNSKDVKKNYIFIAIKGDKFGIIDDKRKDPDITKWPYIKVPNEIEPGKFCGCKEIDTLEEKKDWCKRIFILIFLTEM